ncbi:hypothetical protein V6N11_036996 [Hibiscus sabdariffa]|uniref:Uncharacterized protein n=1 Tax=Hibiscus sabdariffa TaxID=183260 RepID=A0ABR2RCD3_9ROSI
MAKSSENKIIYREIIDCTAHSVLNYCLSLQLNWRKRGKQQQDKKAGTTQEAVRGEHTPSWARVGPTGGRPSRDTCSACREKKMAPYGIQKSIRYRRNAKNWINFLWFWRKRKEEKERDLPLVPPLGGGEERFPSKPPSGRLCRFALLFCLLRTRKRYAKSTKTSTPQSTGNPASDCSLSAEEANVEKEQARNG